MSFKPLVELTNDEQIFPITQMALEQIRFIFECRFLKLMPKLRAYTHLELDTQIPPQDILEYKVTDMPGPMMIIGAKKLID